MSLRPPSRARRTVSVLATVITAAALAVAGSVVSSGPASAADPAWQTVFRDDFSGTGRPDPNKWLLTTGTSYPGGPANFGTGEIETMTDRPENVDVRNGNLYITPQRDTAGNWTSARVESAASTFRPPAGGVMHVESRLQMPNVTGAEAMGYWPAFWMLGGPYRQDRWSWPAIGEFDIMENVQGLNWTYNVLHCGVWAGGPCKEQEGINNGVNNAGAPCSVTTCQAGMHTYGLEWDDSGPVEQLRWYLDGALTFTVNADQVPAATWASLADHAGYFIILNVAMGGAFPNKLGGGPNAGTKPGVPMVVDYVEVKYANGSGTPPTTPTTSTPTTSTPTTSTPTTSTPTTSTPTTSTPTTGAPGGSAAPSNLRVSGSTSDSLTLSWDGSPDGSYEVLRSGIRIATVTGTSFTDRGLLPNTPYVYSIRGAGVTTAELTSRLGEASTSTPTAPPTSTDGGSATGSPSNLRATGTTGSTITLGWDGTAAASYEVLRSGIPIATVTGTSFTDIGLFPNTPYLYSIRGNGTTTPQITARIG
jgi:beta-glucanase (GH16 family)